MTSSFVIGWSGVSLVMSNLLIILALCIIRYSKNRCSFWQVQKAIWDLHKAASLVYVIYWRLQRILNKKSVWIVFSSRVSGIRNAPFKTVAAIATKPNRQIMYATSVSMALLKVFLYSLQSPSGFRKLVGSTTIPKIKYPWSVESSFFWGGGFLFEMHLHIEAWADWAEWWRGWNVKWYSLYAYAVYRILLVFVSFPLIRNALALCSDSHWRVLVIHRHESSVVWLARFHDPTM